MFNGRRDVSPRQHLKLFGFCLSVLLCSGVSDSNLRAESVMQTEYLGTLYAPYDPPHKVSAALSVYPMSMARGGYLRGPNIDSRPIPPCADWYRSASEGSFVIDFRCLFQTKDGALIHMEMEGPFYPSSTYLAECDEGRIIDGKDIGARPLVRFETDSERYGWLNTFSGFGVPVREKCLDGDYFIEYEIHRVR